MKSQFLAGCVFRYAPEWSKNFSYETAINPGFVELIYFVVNPNLAKKVSYWKIKFLIFQLIQGLGSALMKKLVETVKTHNKIKVTKIVTFADNQAVNFFKKQGFRRLNHMQ